MSDPLPPRVSGPEPAPRGQLGRRDGDPAAVRWSAAGTHEGDGLGVPATHRRVRLTGIDILRVQDGRIVERWGETNGLEMMQQVSEGEETSGG